MKRLHLTFALLFLSAFSLARLCMRAAPTTSRIEVGHEGLANYFKAETAQVAADCLAEYQTLDDWKKARPKLRSQLFEMLGLSPQPARTDLKPVITGSVEQEQFTVEKLHFQSLPGLYVTANLYLPKELTHRASTILYLSGHGAVISNGVSYGNKVHYQHHGAWFARNGYICLILDSLQLGEIQGLHHGTYREGMWWWNARGYTPAGVEAWNCLRALDYLSTRPEVDTNRFGVTGRSGGGAYSWWVAALDDRVQAAAPVAGITDLQNHVVDGTVEGHCDCMFMVNTYRWDYAQVAALLAPRPLLIANTDSDVIFPLDGVVRLHAKVRRIYELFGAEKHLGLAIVDGPHKDTQALRVPVFSWFNRHLKKEDPLIETVAQSFFTPEQLKVFEALPSAAVNPNIQATFVPWEPHPTVPATFAEWRNQKEKWMSALSTKVFRGWPEKYELLNLKEVFSVKRLGVRFQAFDFLSQKTVQLRLYTAERASFWRPNAILLNVLDAEPQPPQKNPVESTVRFPVLSYEPWLAAMCSVFNGELSEEIAAMPPDFSGNEAAFAPLSEYLETNHVLLAWVAPRGIGLTAWEAKLKKQIQIRRRFMLLGQTLEGMRVWDIRRAVQAARELEGCADLPLSIQAQGVQSANALYASLFEWNIKGLNLWHLPASHRNGPDYLNILRWLDIPQAVAMAAERCSVSLMQPAAGSWDYAQAVASGLGSE